MWRNEVQNWVQNWVYCFIEDNFCLVIQVFIATLFILSDEYVSSSLYYWYMLLKSRWAVNWETVSQTWWISSLEIVLVPRKELKVILRKSRQKGKCHCEGKKQNPLGRHEKRMRLHPDVLLFKLAAWRAPAVAEGRWEASRPEKSCGRCSRVKEKP